MKNDDQADAAVEALEKIRGDPVLRHFAAPLPKLGEPGGKDLDQTFQRLGELIGASEEAATIRFNVADGGEPHAWSLTTGPDGCKVTTDDAPLPDVELFLDVDTWRLLAQGSTSPIEAFGRGKLRLRGDIRLARRIVGRLQRSKERAAQ